MEAPAVHFGGPDQTPRRLRDLLAERVAAVPAGGRIDWVTYYFRDRQLARELVRARRRGVRVQVTLEGAPRVPQANATVAQLLSNPEGLGCGFRAVVHPSVPAPPGTVWRPHLHEKLYCFSHPRPTIFVGSFNPSGDDPEEDPSVVDEIQDQDRGHNFLVELQCPSVVEGLVAHARRQHTRRHGPLERFSLAANRALRTERLTFHFWPRVKRNPMLRLLLTSGTRERVRIAASHIRGPTARNALLTAARRGVRVEIVSGDTERRFPTNLAQRLSQEGIRVRRISHPDGLPMHNKFLLVDGPRERCLVFGSLNWTERSLRLNHEIAVVARDPRLFGAFAARWEGLVAARTQSGTRSG